MILADKEKATSTKGRPDSPRRQNRVNFSVAKSIVVFVQKCVVEQFEEKKEGKKDIGGIIAGIYLRPTISR